MAKTKATERVADVKPYVKRAIQDEELRDSLRSAFTTARSVYDELIGKRGVSGVATKVASDKDIQDQLRSAIEDLRSAANRVQGKESHKGRNSRSEEHTSELQSPCNLVCRLLLEKKAANLDPGTARGGDRRWRSGAPR